MVTSSQLVPKQHLSTLLCSLGSGCGSVNIYFDRSYSYMVFNRRFPTTMTDNSRWLRERSHEAYSKNYSILYPHDEPLAGRNMRRDALHQVWMAGIQLVQWYLTFLNNYWRKTTFYSLYNNSNPLVLIL